MRRYRLFSWNVNGIRACAKKGLLEWLRRTEPDVLCLQETKAEPAQLPPELAAVAGYSADFHWAEKKGYSGVGTYRRVEAEGCEKGFRAPEFDREGRVLAHRFPEFTLFNVYFPNGKARPDRLDYKLRFYDWFLKLLAGYRKKGQQRLVVCGDVNTAHKEIDLARPKENSLISGFLPQERAWIDRLLEAGFIDTFRVFDPAPARYTWWDQLTRARERNVGWRIDYFFASEELRPHLAGAAIHADVLGSDHCPVELELRF